MEKKTGISKTFKWVSKWLIIVSEKSRWIWESVSKRFLDKRGKPKVGYNTNKAILVGIGLSFVLSLFVYSIFTDKSSRFASLSGYQDKMAETDGMKGRKINKDPNSLNNTVSEKFGSYYADDTATPKVATEFGPNAIAKSLSKDDCLSLIEKAAKKEELSLSQNEDLKACVTNNIMEWDDDKLANAKIMIDPKASEEAKEIARNGVLGKGPNVWDKIADKIKGEGVSPADLDGNDYKNVFGKNGKPKNSAVDKLINDKGTAANAKGDGLNETGDKFNDLKNVANEVDRLSREKKAAEEEADRIRKSLSDNGTKGKAANGEDLSPEEVSDIARLAEINNKMKDLEKERQKLIDRFGFLKNQIDDLVTDANIISEDIAGGGYIVSRKVKSDKAGSGVASIEEIPVNGSPNLNPVDVLKKNDRSLKHAKLRRQELDDKVKLTVQLGWVTGKFETPGLVIPKTRRIIAIMEKFEYSTEMQGLRVRGIILESIINPRTGLIEIPKKSILIGQAGTFSTETGRMPITFTEAWTGGKSIKISLTVASGDGQVGLAGDIYDTRGRRLLATWIGAFTQGVAAWFSEAVLREYEDTKNMTTALIGATLNGVKDVAERTTQTAVSDLNNSPVIFKLQDNTPIVLLP